MESSRSPVPRMYKPGWQETHLSQKIHTEIKSSNHLIGPPAAEGSYELGSIRLSFHPSVFLSGRFLGIGSLVSTETQHGVRDPCVVMRDRAGIFGKKILSQKWGKWAKNRVF